MKKIFIGMMSGTSFDGIDIVASNLDKNNMFTKLSSYKWNENVRDKIKKMILSGKSSFKSLLTLDNEIANIHAEIVKDFLNKHSIKSSDVEAIGFHGQTIWHDFNVLHNSLQLGNPNVLARKTSIKVVSDVRRMDMAGGGNGAPLAPLIHSYLFGKKNERKIVANLGGIANISVLDGNDALLGYDTGPASCLIDEFVQKKFGMEFDTNGNIAREGNIIEELLSKWLENDYFSLPFPKSTGRELFNLKNFKVLDKYNHKDVVRTLTKFTAITLTNDVKKHSKISRLILVGGGCFNGFLVDEISKQLDVEVCTSWKYDIDPMIVEPLLMAYIAKARIERKPLRLKQITGASQNSISGGLYVP